jgi:hypothetical protein
MCILLRFLGWLVQAAEVSRALAAWELFGWFCLLANNFENPQGEGQPAAHSGVI